jgi:inner membrane protein
VSGEGKDRRGFHAVLPEATRQSEHLLHAEVSLELVGTSDFAMAPAADDTRVQLEANWPHPSFGGRFLPVTCDVRPDGSSASWQVSSLATTASLDYIRGAARGTGESVEGKGIESFNVSFIDPSSHIR